MGMFTAFDISATGMTAERYRMDIISQNVANANTTRTEDGTPYRRKIVTFSEKNVTPFSQIYSSSKKAAVGNGVKVSSVTSDYTTFNHVLKKERDRYSGDGVKVTGVYEDNKTEMKMVYDPSHPDADENGYVTYPNVDTVTEMTNLIDASRAYQANATAFEASKNIATTGLNMMNA